MKGHRLVASKGDVLSNHEILGDSFSAPYGSQGRTATMVKARCLCGGSDARLVRMTVLYRGEIQGCSACFQQLSAQSRVQHGFVQSKDYLYFVLHGAKNRCATKRFKHYGGRGIQFFPSLDGDLAEATRLTRDTIGDRPTEKHQLDRIDNDGHYEIGNLRWSTSSENNFNRRTPTQMYAELTNVLDEQEQELLMLRAATAPFVVAALVSFGLITA